jgi:hypothetical protein
MVQPQASTTGQCFTGMCQSASMMATARAAGVLMPAANSAAVFDALAAEPRP